MAGIRCCAANATIFSRCEVKNAPAITASAPAPSATSIASRFEVAFATDREHEQAQPQCIRRLFQAAFLFFGNDSVNRLWLGLLHLRQRLFHRVTHPYALRVPQLNISATIAADVKRFYRQIKRTRFSVHTARV